MCSLKKSLFLGYRKIVTFDTDSPNKEIFLYYTQDKQTDKNIKQNNV